MKFIKRNFYIPQVYKFETGGMMISSSKYVGGLRPYYQQEKFFSTSTSLLSVGIHTIDDSSSSEISLDKVELDIHRIFEKFFFFYLFSRNQNQQYINQKIKEI